MASADSSADDESARRDVELTSEPGSDSTSAVRPSSSMKDGNRDKPRSVPAPAPVTAAPRPGQASRVAPVANLAGLPPLPPLPVPAPPLAPPPPSVPPPANVAASGMPSSSSLSPRPVPTFDPRPITAADLEDDLRTRFRSSFAALTATRPRFFSSLAATRPTNAWLSLGMALVGVAFVFGLLLGRGSAVTHAARDPGAVAGEPTPAPVPPSATLPPAAAPAVTAPSSDATPTPVAATGAAAGSASADATKSAAPKPQLEPFNSKAAHINLANAAARAMHCRDAPAPAGTVSTVVTFVPSGRVADVTVTTPVYAGTHTGKCIIAKLKGAQVPPYSGEPETLKKTITLK